VEVIVVVLLHKNGAKLKGLERELVLLLKLNNRAADFPVLKQLWNIPALVQQHDF
jgi:hypothetical protein